MTSEQLIFSAVSKLPKTSRKRKLPQPRLKSFRLIKKYEILHRPFDLKFRGRLNRWLEKSGFDSQGLEAELSPFQAEIIKRYLFPQGREKRWLTQSQVLDRLRSKPKGRLRDLLVKSLLIVWERARK